MFSRRVVPTGKGFASFLGYYAGAQDYFNHTDAGANDMHHDVGSSLQAICYPNPDPNPNPKSCIWSSEPGI